MKFVREQRFLTGIASIVAVGLCSVSPAQDALLFDCYEPVDNGWHVRLGGDDSSQRHRVVSETPDQVVSGSPDPDTLATGLPGEPAALPIGVIASNDAYSDSGRLHRRPLFPPADRTLLFTPDELAQLDRCPFRPLVLAYNEPRFLFDYHSAGGLLGHLLIGMTTPQASKWFHQWRDLDVSYVRGEMVYAIADPDFPGVTVLIKAAALAQSAGLIAQVAIKDAPDGAKLVWAYGGASAWFTNWAMNAKEFDFAPGQCAKDHLRWENDVFTLTRAFDESDGIMREVFAVAKRLPEWRAHILGGASAKGRCGLGDPNAFMGSPAELVQSADGNIAQDETGVVAVNEIPLDETWHGRPARDSSLYLVLGMGGNIQDAIRHPEAAWQHALARNDTIARRVVTRTPDPYLDAAMSMMAFATEGTWGDVAVVHGGWSWRFAYLGWRTQYGLNCYGWTDRTRKTILNHVRLNRVASGPDSGALGSLIEYDPGVFYNMNEVFFDEVRHYFDYTNDLDLMREILPVLKGIVEWENRRLRPTEAPLYENALNTWISDQHWCIRGQCTQASAYMLRANAFLADLAARLGEDPQPYANAAAAIRDALQKTLWMPRQGVFAEYKDTLGKQLLHPEPELPTIYHSAEFGAADPLQIYQMLHWADTHLRTEATPGGGKLYWSSNWFPNMGRKPTHSTYELAYAEELNFAITNYLAGRADEAYAIIRACLAGIFNGPTPGGLACHAYPDGRQRANDEFADAISMWGRTIVEGLFGIVPKPPDQVVSASPDPDKLTTEGLPRVVELTPQFPSDWPEASIETPHFSYKWSQNSGQIRIEWSSPIETVVRLKLPVHASEVLQARANGEDTAYKVEAGVGLSWVTFSTPQDHQGTIEVSCVPRQSATPDTVSAMQGEKLHVPVPGARDGQPSDLNGILREPKISAGTLEATVTGEPGPALVLAAADAANAPYWIPIRLQIRPETPIPAKVWTPPSIPDRDLSCWTLVDLRSAYNASVTDAMQRVWEALKPPPAPASEINTAYYKDHLVEPFVSPPPSDAAWRAKIGNDNIGWTTDGIPFLSTKEGPNIAVVTRAAHFPPTIEFPVNAAGKTLYLMISGTTFAMQSHVVNLRVTLRYENGDEHPVDLVNPTGIGDCWNQYRYHDTAANGFENIGGRSGPAGSSQAGDLTQPIPVDTEAHLLAFDLNPNAELDSVRLEAIANEIVFGIMGASVFR